MSRYAATVEYVARTYGTDPRVHECEIVAPDVDTAEERAIELVELLGIASKIRSATATLIVEDTPAENDAKIQELITDLRKEFAPRGDQWPRI